MDWDRLELIRDCMTLWPNIPAGVYCSVPAPEPVSIFEESHAGFGPDMSRETKKPRTAVKGKRYRCAVCRKRSPKPVLGPAPWYCEKHARILVK